MYCKNCGKEVDNMASVCMGCGVSTKQGKSFCPNCGEETNPMAQVCVKCGYNINAVGEAKSKIAAGLLGIFLGGFGIHRFYLGYTGIGIIQIVVTMVTCGIGSLWGLIEGILILVGSTITTDAKGVPFKD